MKASTIKKINEHLEKARKKHPEFAPGGPLQVVSIATEELGELSKEVNDWVNKLWICPQTGERQNAKNGCGQKMKP